MRSPVITLIFLGDICDGSCSGLLGGNTLRYIAGRTLLPVDAEA